MTPETPNWYALAQHELGVSEIPGSRHNSRIVEYFRQAGWGHITDDETAWCAAFASAILRWAGQPSPQTVRARDFLNWGYSLEQPIRGCVVVLRRGNNPNQGHVGFFDKFSDDGKWISLLGGNQANKVCFAWFRSEDVLGYRWPNSVVYDQREPEVSVSYEPPTLPDRPPPPRIPFSYYPESAEDVTKRLRAKGSRIVTGADRAELQAKGVATTAIMALVSGVVSAFSEAFNLLSPLAPVLGLSVLGAIALALAVYTIHEQKRIRAARVEDDMNGLHIGRKDGPFE